MMPTSLGARLRYTLDRDGETYKETYRQCTAVERINSQSSRFKSVKSVGEARAEMIIFPKPNRVINFEFVY